jgi:hypothetical protein
MLSRRESASPIPEPIVQLQRQPDRFRSSHAHRTKLPESLWHSAAELARQHGLYLVARPLRLDYAQLKRRMGEVGTVSKQATAPAFVELIASPAVTMAECMMESESSMGGKMRITSRCCLL